MGGSKRGKGHVSHHVNGSRSKQTAASPQTDHSSSQHHRAVTPKMNSLVVDEIDCSSSSNNVFTNWREVGLLFLIAAALGVVSVAVGVAAGMTISIHYYEDPVHRFDRDRVVVSAQRITSSDMAVISAASIDGRVITKDKSGQRSVLSVVHPSATEPTTLNDSSGSPPSGATVTSSDHAWEGDSVHVTFGDIFMREPTVSPSLCDDGETMGFQDYKTLKAAIREANALSADRFVRWNEYFAAIEGYAFGAFEDDSLYFEDNFVFTICPGATLKARKGPIFINAENIILECDDCTVDVGGTHLAFGPHAKNVLVRGITFRGAQTSSLTFYYDGAEAVFEDCTWAENAGIKRQGAVADVNSTSSVSFYRCEVSETRVNPRRNSRRPASGGNQEGFASSLTVRGG